MLKLPPGVSLLVDIISVLVPESVKDGPISDVERPVTNGLVIERSIQVVPPHEKPRTSARESVVLPVPAVPCVKLNVLGLACIEKKG
jgi:hypothetical protein